MSSAFEKPERSCFNLAHYARLIPDNHAIFVMPPGCSRILKLTAIEMGFSDRFTMFNLDQSDLISGEVENILIDGAKSTIQRLTEENRRPRVFSLFVSCVDTFIGTDHSYVMDALREFAPDIHFLDLAVDPINRPTKPPLIGFFDAVTALFQRDSEDRFIHWLGLYHRPRENDPLLMKLTDAGIRSKHLLDCASFDDFIALGSCAANVITSVMAVPAAKTLKQRLGIPYYNLLDPSDPDSMTEEALLRL